MINKIPIFCIIHLTHLTQMSPLWILSLVNYSFDIWFIVGFVHIFSCFEVLHYYLSGLLWFFESFSYILCQRKVPHLPNPGPSPAQESPPSRSLLLRIGYL